jgi:hypothetical protein
MTRHPHLTLPLMMALSLASAATQATDLATATASVSKLRYRLIDLDPNDGIAPSLSVTGKLDAVASASFKVTPDDGSAPSIQWTDPRNMSAGISSPIFGQTGTLDFFTTEPQTKASLGPTLSVGVGLSKEALAASAITKSEQYTYRGTAVDGSSGVDISRPYTTTQTNTTNELLSWQGATIKTTLDQVPAADGSRYPTYAPNLTLSAHTLLMIEGTASIATYMDRSALDTVARTAWVDSGNFSSGVYANIDVSILSNKLSYEWSTLPDGTTLKQLQVGSFALDKRVGALGDYYHGTEYLETADDIATQNFTVSYLNNTDTSTQTVLDISLSASAHFGSGDSYSRTSTTWDDAAGGGLGPTIPEPSTYALMGLGLAGIALASRRQRRGS